MKDKIGIIIGAGITVLVIFTLSIYLIAKDSVGLFDMITIPIIIIILLSSTYIIWDRVKNVKKGLPVADERLKLVGYKAGYYAFIAAIWSALGSNFLSIILYDQDLRGGLVVAAVVLVSGIVFMFSYLYFSRRG
jgi:hypothetical protein